jgi:hypothetical protein
MGRLIAVIAGRVAPLAFFLGLAALSACAQLAGIDDTSGGGGNSITVTRMSIGKTVVTAPLDLAGLEASYLVENPASALGFDRVPARAGNGRWSAEVATIAPVELTLPDVSEPLPHVFAFPNRALHILYSVLEHVGRSPAPDGATIGVMLDLETAYVAADRFQAYTVGSWTSRSLAANEILQPPDMGATQISTLQPYAYASSASAAGRLQLDRHTADDVFLILRYAGAVLTGVAEADPFTQNGSDTVHATMSTVARDLTLDVKLDTANLATRFSAARPAMSGLSLTWSLVASPGYRIAFVGGPALNSGTLMPTDAGLQAAYGNPFADRGWNTMFTLATSTSRVYTPMGTTTPVTLVGGINQFIEPSAGFTLKLDAGLPVLIQLNGTALLTDGQAFPTPTKFVAVTFSTDLPSNTLYNLEVYDLLPNMAGTALGLHLVFGAASKETRFQIPPEILEEGHSYTLRVIALAGGHPTVGTGDLSNRELPLSQSYFDSAVIKVVAP